MPTSIKTSVGKGGKNEQADVKTVQELLNPFASQAGFSKLKADGQPSSKLDKAISGFQEKICGFRPDGRVDPGKRTIKKLAGGPNKAKAEKQKEEKQVQQIKVQEQQKIIDKVKKDMEAAAKSQKVDSSSWGDLWKSVSTQAEDLFESFWAKDEKNGNVGTPDDAQKQAKKISDMMNKEVKKTIDKKIKEIDTGGTDYPGKVTGKVTGVKKPLIDALTAVSSHYEGTAIHVTSGLRDKKGQARAMFKYWDKHLKKDGKNGGVYWFCRQAKYQDLWKELDDFKTANDQAGFTKCMMAKAPWGSVSRHLSGQAVDISLQTDAKILGALKMVFGHYLPEKDGNSEGIKCHHFDDKKGIKKVDDSLRAKFPK